MTLAVRHTLPVVRREVRSDPDAARRAYVAAQRLREALELLGMEEDAVHVRLLQGRLWERMR